MRLALVLFASSVCFGQVVPYVESLVSRGDLSSAQNLADQYRRQFGTTPETLAVMSWVARGELNAHQYEKALTDAEEIQRILKAALAGRKLDTNPFSPTALGASYEVQAQALAALSRRSEAIQLLQSAEQEFRGTSIVPRLQKNLLLLTLVGHPLPEIHGTPNAWRGKPVLVFFWAHWCSDCKAMSPIIAKLATEFEPKGLIVVAPTRLYGYTPQQENASPADEKLFIDKVFQRFYAIIPNAIVSLDTPNFDRFGVSTTPTIVVADKQGTVRLYHPGSMPEQTLKTAIAQLIKPN